MDRISGLSDELLLKILMLVPTEVAVSTSILSKRWEYLWMWLPKLDYCHRLGSGPDCERLRCFLDRNLPLHRAPVIESFRLEWCNPRFKPKNINMWVLTAVSHCVRELEILYESYQPKPLVILKLGGRMLLDVPRMISLPSLKTLKLQSVRYFSDETLQRLLSNSPILEDLVVDLREHDTTRELSVVVPSLQSLSLYLPYNIMLQMVEAYLDVFNLPDLKSLIGSITSVKRLAICSEAMYDEGFVFDQLEHLEVCICKDHFPSQLIRLLKASSNLQGLHIFFIEDYHDHILDGMEDWNEPSTVPECMLSSLQSLSWSKYTGEAQEKDIMIYILEHALHLKTATIKSSSESDVPKLEMLKELAFSSRASTTCKLMFD
ncbi:hypothetical protein BRARA_I03799 [Brassica rapa]|uniref:FBD domain-containing protein n=1 Tax=Brassica campestris TaxID=3711 RepID=A0A397Y0M7_BRACM|nr:hypothetical protein BRARA_I03799 [Brassica rapa]